MSKKTLYKHFRSKNEIVEEILRTKFAELEEGLRGLAAEKLEFEDGLGRILLLSQEHAGEVHPAFVRDLRKELPELFQFIQARRRELIQKYFGELLKTGSKAGKVRKDFPAPLLTEVLLGLFDTIVNPAKLAELELGLKEGIKLITSIFLDGVLIQKGGKSKP